MCTQGVQSSRQSNCTRGGASTVCSASGSDSGSPSPAHYLKPESSSEDGSSSVNGGGNGNAASSCGRAAQEEQNDASSSAGNRCIAGVFAGHGEVKSVLGTVVKFATGISPDTGDTVLTLVLALLVNSLPLLFALSSLSLSLSRSLACLLACSLAHSLTQSLTLCPFLPILCGIFITRIYVASFFLLECLRN